MLAFWRANASAVRHDLLDKRTPAHLLLCGNSGLCTPWELPECILDFGRVWPSNSARLTAFGNTSAVGDSREIQVQPLGVKIYPKVLIENAMTLVRATPGWSRPRRVRIDRNSISRSHATFQHVAPGSPDSREHRLMPRSFRAIAGKLGRICTFTYVLLMHLMD